MSDIYFPILITEKVSINVSDINSNIKTTLHNKIISIFEGKCNNDGYVKIGSCKIINYTPPVLYNDYALYTVTLSCDICNPPKDMIIDCIVKNHIQTTGAVAYIDSKEDTPVIIYILRDFHLNNEKFMALKKDDKIQVSVITSICQLNNDKITVIANLI